MTPQITSKQTVYICNVKDFRIKFYTFSCNSGCFFSRLLLIKFIRARCMPKIFPFFFVVVLLLFTQVYTLRGLYISTNCKFCMQKHNHQIPFSSLSHIIKISSYKFKIHSFLGLFISLSTFFNQNFNHVQLMQLSMALIIQKAYGQTIDGFQDF